GRADLGEIGGGDGDGGVLAGAAATAAATAAALSVSGRLGAGGLLVVGFALFVFAVFIVFAVSVVFVVFALAGRRLGTGRTVVAAQAKHILALLDDGRPLALLGFLREPALHGGFGSAAGVREQVQLDGSLGQLTDMERPPNQTQDLDGRFKKGH